jgi:hypothetical protein
MIEVISEADFCQFFNCVVHKTHIDVISIEVLIRTVIP